MAALAATPLVVMPPEPAAGSAEPAPAPLAVTQAMRVWAHAVTAGLDGPFDRLRALHAALTEPAPGAIAEITAPTPTATEAFRDRRADCVGFALLLVSMAREVGVDARFVLTPAAAEIDDEGSLRVRTLHLAVLLADRVFDLGGEGRLQPGVQHAIADRTALALYHSNQGVQALAADRVGRAVELLWKSIQLDPSVDSSWTNLGVALRRAGDAAGAILAHQMALRIDPDDEAARRNLGVALLAGSAAEARD
jgi:tetratricopeptide (TPR) repeat protein